MFKSNLTILNIVVLLIISGGINAYPQQITKIQPLPPKHTTIRIGIGNSEGRDLLAEESPERFAIWNNSRNAILQVIDRDNKEHIEKMDLYLGEVRRALEAEVNFYNRTDTSYQELGIPLPKSPFTVASVVDTFATFAVEGPDHPKNNKLVSSLGPLSSVLTFLDKYAYQLDKGEFQPTIGDLLSIKKSFEQTEINEAYRSLDDSYEYALKYFHKNRDKANEVKSAQKVDLDYFSANQKHLFSEFAPRPERTVARLFRLQNYAFLKEFLENRNFESGEISKLLKKQYSGEFMKRRFDMEGESLFLDKFTCLSAEGVSYRPDSSYHPDNSLDRDQEKIIRPCSSLLNPIIKYRQTAM